MAGREERGPEKTSPSSPLMPGLSVQVLEADMTTTSLAEVGECWWTERDPGQTSTMEKAMVGVEVDTTTLAHKESS